MSSTQCKYWGYWCLADKYVMLYKDNVLLMLLLQYLCMRVCVFTLCGHDSEVGGSVIQKHSLSGLIIQSK